MNEQQHSGSGDNVGGDQTKINRQINQGNESTYIEQQIINQAAKIEKFLTQRPFIPTIFQGREDALKQLHEQLFNGSSLLLLVNGEGGIGKTSLAAKYWENYQDHYQHLGWVFCQSSVQDALLSLAIGLNLTFPPTQPNEERLYVLLRTLANLPKPCLLVLDNLNDLVELKQHYASLTACPNFHVMLTSRITAFDQAAIFHVLPLAEEQALNIFKAHYRKHRPEEDDLFKGIFKAVGGNTLVMELLAKNLAVINADEASYSLSNLLQDIQSLGLLALSQTEAVAVAQKGKQITFVDALPTAIIQALYSDLEMVVPLNEHEQGLLSILAVLPAEKFSFTLLKELAAPEDSKLFSKTLKSLAQRGWLERTETEDSAFYKISPVVQEITRHKNQDALLGHCSDLILSLIDKLAYEPGTGHLINCTYQEAALLASYAESVVHYLNQPDYNLGVLCERIGNYYNTTGNLERALGYFEEYYRLNTELYAASPNNVSFKNLLAISYEKLGDTHTALGNLERALGYFEERSQLGKELYEADPSNVEFKNGLAISYEKLGSTYTAQGNLERALGYFEEYYRLNTELYEAYPSNVSFKNGLAISYEKLGATHTALGSLERALGYFEEYYRLNQELYEAFPSNVAFKNGLAISYEKLGSTHTALGNLERALGYFEVYYRLNTELYEAYPSNVSFKNGLAISYSRLGSTHSALGNLDRALGYFEEDLQLTKELYEAYPSNVSFKNGLAISYSKLGDTHRALGNLERALGYFEERSQLGKELYAAYPSNVSFKNGLAVSYSRLGIIHEQLNDNETATGNYQQCKILWEKLHYDFPAYVEFKNNLNWVNGKLSDLQS